MNTSYPSDLKTVGSWAKDNGIPLAEARARYAQYVILEAVASSQQLQWSLVFKGGNALDFVWQPNRSTRDLDFSLDVIALPGGMDERQLGMLLGQGLRAVQQRAGLMLRVGRVERQPRGPDKSFTALRTRIHYAFPGQERHYRLMEADPLYKAPMTVPLDVSMYEPICEAEYIPLRVGIARS